jgi:uncharacterized protein YndB with AHSA1/START domain
MDAATDPDIRVRGRLWFEDGLGVVRIELDVDTPIADVWTAATDPERLRGWLGEVQGDLRVGGDYTALLFPSGWEGGGRVLECDGRGRWSVDGAEPGRALSTTTLELAPTDSGGTHASLSQRGIGAEQLAFHGVGVQIHLENLASFLQGDGPVDPDPYWGQLLEPYQRMAAAL